MTTKPTDADIIKALDWCEQVEDNVLLSDVKATKFTFALQSLQTIKQVLKDYNRLKAENEEVRKDIVTAEKYAWQLKAKNEALQMDNEQLKSDIINERMNLEHIQAENEALISAQETMQKHIEKAKTEAIKEVIGRLQKSITSQLDVSTLEQKAAYCFCLDEIDEIELELVGDIYGQAN